MAYNKKAQNKKEYRSGKWYHLDELYPLLPGNLITNMFRKPEVGEITPDGILMTNKAQCDTSEYEQCFRQFAITVKVLYNE